MSWECPDCKFDNHEMRSKCRNCKTPRDDKSKEPKDLGEKKMAKVERKPVRVLKVEPGTSIHVAAIQLMMIAGEYGFAEMTIDGIRIETDGSEMASDIVTRYYEILDRKNRVRAHDRAMQEERDRAARTRYCGITDEMVPVDQKSGVPLSKILRRAKEIVEDKRSIPNGHNITGVRPIKPVNARKIIEAIMDRMEQDQAFHKGVMIELAVLYGCEAEKGE